MRGMGFCRCLLLMFSLLIPSVFEGAVGKLVEANAMLQAGETWSFKTDSATVLSSVEIRGRLSGKGEADSAGSRGWSLVLSGWGKDSVAAYVAVIELPSMFEPELVEPKLRISAGNSRDVLECGSERPGREGDDSGCGVIYGGEVSVALMFSGDGMVEVWYGDESLARLGSFYAGAEGAGRIDLSAFSPVELVSVNVRTAPAREYLATGWNEELLASRLKSSSDFREGIYEYLDSDIDADRSRLGGAYRLAVVSDGRGGYDIIYLGGAEENSREWKPGMRKGKLIPTIFQNHYDMTWTDSRMADDMEELSGELDGTLLVLHFPMERAVVRFRRSRQGR